MADHTPDPDALVDMAHPALPAASPVRVTRRQLELVWEAHGWRETAAPAEPDEVPGGAPAPSETAAPRRKTPLAAEAAQKEN
ncbi:hypothetical protein ACFVZR_07735 [Streptomyces sp. NPDC058316]|uniref:hypothetical protein n=1 Tax=Streptomyces sp. NPDC058316 TaxID=3346442 RepID=UPI0036ED9346